MQGYPRVYWRVHFPVDAQQELKSTAERRAFPQADRRLELNKELIYNQVLSREKLITYFKILISHKKVYFCKIILF